MPHRFRNQSPSAPASPPRSRLSPQIDAFRRQFQPRPPSRHVKTPFEQAVFRLINGVSLLFKGLAVLLILGFAALVVWGSVTDDKRTAKPPAPVAHTGWRDFEQAMAGFNAESHSQLVQRVAVTHDDQIRIYWPSRYRVDADGKLVRVRP